MGVRPCKKFLKAIKAYLRPDTLSEDRSFLGMIKISQSARFSVATIFKPFSSAAAANLTLLCSVMEPFRHLLKPDTWAVGFSRTKELEEGFKLAKERTIEAVANGVKHFEVGRETCLANDWSKQGIGFLAAKRQLNKS